MSQKVLNFKVKGMTCSNCKMSAEKATSKVSGVISCNVNLLNNSMEVIVEDDNNIKDLINAIKKSVKSSGYSCEIIKGNEDITNSELKSMILKRLIPSLILFIPLLYISICSMNNPSALGILNGKYEIISIILMILSLIIMVINFNVIKSGILHLIKLEPNMDSLISLGCLISYTYSIVMFILAIVNINNVKLHMEYFMSQSFETSGMILSFLTIGKTLEEYTKGKTKNALASLLKLMPEKAIVIKDDVESEINIDEIQINDILLIKPDSIIPVDGIIIEGDSYIDESTLTGEPIPIHKSLNDYVYQSSKNTNSYLKIKAIKLNKESTFSKIIEMVKEASNSKSKATKLADTISKYFVPIVFLISILTFVLWITVGSNYIKEIDTMMNAPSYAIKRAISVLVISCPCALGLATPVAVMAGTGKAASNAIFFKNANAMENLSRIKYAVFDKTGTLTSSNIKVESYQTLLDLPLLKEIIYKFEKKSDHPLSNPLKEFSKDFNDTNIEIKDFKSESGKGLSGFINNEFYEIGNRQDNIDDDHINENIKHEKNKGNIVITIYKNNEFIAYISLTNEIKENSLKAINFFKSKKIKTVLLTGDDNLTATYIGNKLGIDQIHSQLNPEEKLNKIDLLKQEGLVMMVGDGVNDAPALVKADIGVALSSGKEVAIESSDVILKNDDIINVCKAYKIARKTRANIIENLLWALIYNLIMIPIAAGGFINFGVIDLLPWMCSISMALSSVCVVLNALRLNLINLNKVN